MKCQPTRLLLDLGGTFQSPTCVRERTPPNRVTDDLLLDRRDDHVVRPHDFPRRDLDLRSHDDLVRALDSGCAPAQQLSGTKAGQHDEFKGADTGWTMNHVALSSEARCCSCDVDSEGKG